MPKPIGNQIANVKSTDKVSRRLAARFGPRTQAPSAGEKEPQAAAAPAKKVRKFKTRKK